jgi:hypothetical protein
MPYIWLVLTTGPNGRERRIGLFKLPSFYLDFHFNAQFCIRGNLKGALFKHWFFKFSSERI